MVGWTRHAAVFVATTAMIVTGGVTQGVAAGPLTNRTNVAYSNGLRTSKGHIFAARLDWSKPVGMMIYADGSGERGLRSYNDSYLLDADGTTGLVEVARKRNMVLVTPFAPGGGCDDGDGTCWYDNSGSVTIAQKTQWVFDFVQWVRGQYNVSPQRIVLGGYSSGAQLVTEYLGPQYGEQLGVDLMVAISFGGAPQATPSYSDAFKSHTPVVWNVGGNDPYRDFPPYDVKSGHDWYTAAGFQTELTVVPGMTHSRSDFDTVMARAVDRYIPTQ